MWRTEINRIAQRQHRLFVLMSTSLVYYSTAVYRNCLFVKECNSKISSPKRGVTSVVSQSVPIEMGKLKSIPAVEKPSKKCTRKELRKEKRLLKKRTKVLFYEKLKKGKQNTSSQFTSVLGKNEANVHKCSDPGNKPTKKVRFSNVSEEQEETKGSNNSQIKQIQSKNNLQEQMQRQRKRQLLDAVKEDEKEIKTLEKRLKLNKRKNKLSSRGFVECGLDYILDVCDGDRAQSVATAEVNFEDSDSEFFEDVSFVEGKHNQRSSEENKQQSNENPHKTLNKINSSTSELIKEGPDLSCSENEEESVADSSKSLLSSESNSENDSILSDHIENAKNKVQEDIYGRLRDSKGNVIKVNQDKYIPPHLRLSDNSEIDKAKKQIKGLLNRLAQSNMNSIVNEIENIYSKNSRHAINEIIIESFLDDIVTNVLSPQRLIIDHAMLIGILHGNIGMEVGAYMLQRFVEHFNSIFFVKNQVENKELDNILYLISYMYSFKIFEACLMYDILNKLCSDYTEKNVDLILVILKSVGFSLRKDDPSAMKQFLLSVQKHANQLSAGENSRMKYMLGVLINIKNNNISKLSEFDPAQHEQHRKALKSLVRKGNNIVPLRIGLDDLLNVEERGRWWLVGSAWKTDDVKKVQDRHYTEKYSDQLLQLAKKQRMNTDNRRNIFCILMTAEDYQDAFEKIIRLGLKGQQEREIPLVIVHCLLQENNYNPFYGFVADQLCMSNRRHQMTLQCALWDRFRDLQSLTSFQIHILSQFLSQLLIAGSLPISVLKVVEFAELDKQHIRLLRQTLLSVANEKSIDNVKAVFIKVSKGKKLSLFREALKLFVHHFILRNMAEGDLRERLIMISTMLASES